MMSGKARFRLLVCVGLVLVSGTTGWLAYRVRYTLKGHWYWQQWTRAANAEDEARWRKAVFSEPGATEKIAVAIARAGADTPRQTYWVVTGRAVEETELLEKWARLFIGAAAHRSELVELRFRALRWTPPTSRPRGMVTSSPDWLERTDRRLDRAARTELMLPALQAILPFLEVSTVTGRFDLARGVNESNWTERYEEWHAWYAESGKYLRWEEAAERFVVDEEARTNGLAVAANLQLVPPSRTPLPGWEGDPPE